MRWRFREVGWGQVPWARELRMAGGRFPGEERSFSPGVRMNYVSFVSVSSPLSQHVAPEWVLTG